MESSTHAIPCRAQGYLVIPKTFRGIFPPLPFLAMVWGIGWFQTDSYLDRKPDFLRSKSGPVSSPVLRSHPLCKERRASTSCERFT